MESLDEDTPPINVLVKIIDHVSDLPTLFSLLTVSNQVFEITSRRLYRNPFSSAALATHQHRVYGRLFEFFIDFSFEPPLMHDIHDDHDILLKLKNFRRRTQTNMQQPSRMDYLALLESMNGLVEYVASPKLAISMHWVEQATGQFWGTAALVNAATSALAWLLGKHQQWQRLTEIVVPLYDLDRFASTIDNMQAVQHIVFDMGQPEVAPISRIHYNHLLDHDRSNDPHPGESRSRLDMIQSALRYVQQWEARRLVDNSRCISRLKTVDFVRLTREEWADVAILESVKAVYDMTTMAASADRFRALERSNWTTFLRLASTDADFDAVESIDFLSYDAEPPSTPSPLPSIPQNQVVPELVWQRLRSLRSLAIHCSSPDTFQWTRQTSSRPQGEGDDSSGDTVDLADRKQRSRNLPPLQHLLVEFTATEYLSPLVWDVMTAFGETLCTARFECWPSITSHAISKAATERDIDDPSFRHGPAIQIGSSSRSEWSKWPNCAHLTSLHLSVLGMLHWEEIARVLPSCLGLEVLEVQDDTPKYSFEPSISSTSTMATVDWNLLYLRRLVLKGYPAATFTPASLRAMRTQLTMLELHGAGWLGDERRFFIPPASETRQSKIQAWRQEENEEEPGEGVNNVRRSPRWWQLPKLESLKLVGECALWFPVETVLAQEACPRLKTLSLDIGGHRFPSLIGKKNGGTHPKEQGGGEVEDGAENRSRRQGSWEGGPDGTSASASPSSCLTSLSLIGAWQVTDATLSRLLRLDDGLCPRLEVLTLCQARNYTNAWLVAMAEQHPTLERVVTSRYLRGKEAKRAGLELLPWPGRPKGGSGDHENGSNHPTLAAPPTSADLAWITRQKDLRCIIYQMDTFYYRRTTRSW